MTRRTSFENQDFPPPAQTPEMEAVLQKLAEIMERYSLEDIQALTRGLTIIAEVQESLGLQDKQIDHFAYIREITKELELCAMDPESKSLALWVLELMKPKPIISFPPEWYSSGEGRT